MQLTGIHHLTAVTANARENYNFYTQTLGMRLVKKTVNQDDVTSYHLFYADGEANPGTDITFFDWPAKREKRGTSSVIRTGFRVAGVESINYWSQRFKELSVIHSEAVERDGRVTLDFEDAEGQRLSLLVDDRDDAASPWDKSPVPPEYQIRGLGPITISVPKLAPTDAILTQVMNMKQVRQYEIPPSSDRVAGEPNDALTKVYVYEMGNGGASAELHVALEPSMKGAFLGSGGVHHVAFRVPTYEEYDQWGERLDEFGVRSSGAIDRFYFRSRYFREPGGILFELATDEPGFTADEKLSELGEHLSLPPFLEARRKEIEAGLKEI